MKKEGIKIPTLVKWAGGKKQLIKQFELFFPEKIERYFEPFLGGGAIAFYILKKYKPKKVILSDINTELINTYKIVKNDVENLIEELKKLKKLHNEKNYYLIREEKPYLLSPLTSAARFIYLNKTCFNGLYRVNSRGDFNVPIGKSNSPPAICSENDLIEISKLLKNVSIKVMPFEKIVNLTKKNDFIYFDPPYYPLNKDSFTTYTKDKFLDEEQKKLKEIFEKLDEKGCKLMLSNSDTKFIKELYREYNLKFVDATRMINCDGDNRKIIKEVIIRNYESKCLPKSKQSVLDVVKKPKEKMN